MPMKIEDQSQRQKKQRQQRCDASYSESVRAKWFCCAFKLGFLQLMRKVSLIFNSHLELALSTTLKERKSYQSKRGGVQMFENMRLIILFNMFLNPGFEMTTSFANVARITTSTNKFMY